MTTSTTALPGRPPVVDLATWQTARDELLVREKAHTRAGDALAAARRRLPMVEIDATTEVVGADGPVPFLDLFQGRDELVIYHHMWHDGVPHQGQCAGCTFNVWQMKDTTYLTARGVSFAVLTSGRWDEVAPFVAFMGYAQPWYSVRGVEAPIATDEGHIVCYLRDGDRAFLTYRTTGRGNEPADGSVGLLDMTPYGRGEAWEDNPEGWPEAPQAGSPVGGSMGFITSFLRDGDRVFLNYSTTGRGNERVNGSLGLLDMTPYGRGEAWEDNPQGWPEGRHSCWSWRTDAEGNPTWGPTSRPVPQWTRHGATPVESLGRHGNRD